MARDTKAQGPTPLRHSSCLKKGLFAGETIKDDEKATESLVGALGDSSKEVRDYALKTLSNRGEKAVEPLIRGLGSENCTVRENSVLL